VGERKEAGVTDAWHYDVICVGGGLGGLAAAVTAHENGLRALIVEKSALVGGVTAWSGGQVWVPGNHLAATHGITDSWRAGADHLERIGAGSAHRPLLEVLCERAAEAAWYFEQLGMRWQVILGLPDYSYGHAEHALAEGRYLEPRVFRGERLGEWRNRTRNFAYGLTSLEQLPAGGIANSTTWDLGLIAERERSDIRCNGAALSGWFAHMALERGVELETNARVLQLLTGPSDDGTLVTGIRARFEDGVDRDVVASRGVLLATGGYDWNATMVDRYDAHAEYSSMAPPAITGDHLALAGSIGAQISSNEVPAKPGAFGFIIPGTTLAEGQPDWRPFQYGHPHAILVNRAGERFGEEAMYLGVTHAFTQIDGVTQTRPNDPCFVIFDAQYRAKYPVGGILPDEDLPANVIQSDTLGGLADALGIDRTGLERQVTRFNAAAAKGEDPEFGRGTNAWSKVWFGDPNQKPNAVLGTIERPPFYGSRLVPGGYSLANAGLVGTADAQILDHHDRPIDGLYAAGNSLAKIDIGTGYQSGLANARGMTYGYLAALHMARHPQRVAV
jgi:3-oxosteroid 1-dehydrogenase